MDAQLDYDALEAALRRCGASWTAAQCHGLLAGRLAVAGYGAGPGWLEHVLEGTDARDALRNECEELLSTAFELAYRQLTERLSKFELLLPDDDEDADVRATAMAHWCEGFLHGLVSAKHDTKLKQQLAAEPLADIIKDMLQITRATLDDDDDAEGSEEAYVELVEYLRVAAQLAYEELAEIRSVEAGAESTDPTSDTLH